MQTTAIRARTELKSPLRLTSRASNLSPSTAASASTSSEGLGERFTLSEGASTSATAKNRLQSLSQMSRRLMGETIEPSHSHATSVHRHDHDPEEASVPNAQTTAQLDRERQGYGHISNGLNSGETQQFRNSNGKAVAMVISRGTSSSGYQGYAIRTGTNRFDVKVADGVDDVIALGRITDYYSQQPDNFQGAVDQITVEKGPNPKNAYWAERYSYPGFRSAATGGGGRITFFNGLDQLRESSFDHEFGHNVGFAARSAQDRAARRAGTFAQAQQQDARTGDNDSPNIPRGYSAVMRGDGNSISSYGDRSVAEDFAEFYEEFRSAQDSGGRGIDNLRQRYPNRFKHFEEQVFVHWFTR